MNTPSPLLTAAEAVVNAARPMASDDSADLAIPAHLVFALARAVEDAKPSAAPVIAQEARR